MLSLSMLIAINLHMVVSGQALCKYFKSPFGDTHRFFNIDHRKRYIFRFFFLFLYTEMNDISLLAESSRIKANKKFHGISIYFLIFLTSESRILLK